MKKADKAMDIRPEYDFSKGIRGKYAKKYAKGTNIILLDPDVAGLFPNAKAVNDALRALAKIAQQKVIRAG
jgi:hypothetical protein